MLMKGSILMSTSLILALLLLSGYYLTTREDGCVVCETSDCEIRDVPCECGTGSGMSCLPDTCPDMLGCCKINCIKWTNVCQMSCCERSEMVRLAENGYETWHTCPVDTAARFLNSSCIPCEFRGKPAYLKDKKEYCSKFYVLLGISCVGDIALELECIPSCNTTVYTVSRYAVIC